MTVVDDVADDAGDVVRPAAAQGQRDEAVGAVLRVAVAQGLEQRLGADDVGEPVGAEQVAVAEAGLADGHVGLDGDAVERPQDHRLARMLAGLLER